MSADHSQPRRVQLEDNCCQQQHQPSDWILYSASTTATRRRLCLRRHSILSRRSVCTLVHDCQHICCCWLGTVRGRHTYTYNLSTSVQSGSPPPPPPQCSMSVSTESTTTSDSTNSSTVATLLHSILLLLLLWPSQINSAVNI